MTDIPTRFEDAIEGFKTFLAGQSLKGELLWLFLDDVALQRGKYLVHFPIPEQNELETKLLYEAGVRDGHGVGLHCFAQHEGMLFCYIRHALVNDTYGMEMMPGTLRFSCGDMRWSVQPFRGRFLWWTIRTLGRQWLTEFPTLASCRNQRGIYGS